MHRIFTVLLLAILVAGCTGAQKGAGIGTLIGAGAGAIIGHQSGERDKGAAIGAAVGALGGAATGHQISKTKYNPKTGKRYPSHMKYDPNDGTLLLDLQQ